jgi:predicted DNA-binding transcriptional regulator YafY
LAEIAETFAVDHRTAQRMTKALEQVFPNCTTRTDEDMRKFWGLKTDHARLMLAQGLRDSELMALDLSIRRADREGAQADVRALESLRDRLLASMPGPHARRAEADAEALLEAYGYASRPGPKVRLGAEFMETIAEALKGPNVLTVVYAGGSRPNRERRLEPHGVLLGTRRYLVARETNGNGGMHHYRLDRIVKARLEADSFVRAPDFDLTAHSARAFGSFHRDEEFGEVIWRFTPAAARVAREFLFHPNQEIVEEPDGSLVVRFMASGHLEMAWHLYTWGDGVEVFAPDSLRDLVDAHRRADFPALP